MRQELLLFLAGLALVAAGCGLTSSVDEIPLNEVELGEGVLEAVLPLHIQKKREAINRK